MENPGGREAAVDIVLRTVGMIQLDQPQENFNWFLPPLGSLLCLTFPPRLGDDKGARHKPGCDKEILQGCGSLERSWWKGQAGEERGTVCSTDSQAAAGSFLGRAGTGHR